jgi:hypothetical protein
MSLSRRSILSLLIALCVATAAAQSSPAKTSASAQGKVERNDDSLLDSRMQRPLTLTFDPNDAVCYTIRAYRVARENPESDVVRPAGYSTCQRASRFQFRTAVDSREIAPR